MRPLRTLRLLCLSTLCFVSTHIFAFDIAAVGVGDLAMPSLMRAGTTAIPSTPRLGVGFGAIAGVYSLFPGFTIETGILSVTRKFSLDSTSTSDPTAFLPIDTLALSMIEIPVLVRFDLLPIIAVGVGGYLGFGGSTVTRSSVVLGDTSETREQNNLGKTDFGLMFSASVALPILPLVKLLVDARYLLGLANASTLGDGTTFKMRDLQVLAGIRVSI